jgi:hypothetical protein
MEEQDYTIEELIIQNILNFPAFTAKTVSYIDPDYFEDSRNKALFEICAEYYKRTTNVPEPKILKIELLEKGLDQELLDETKQLVSAYCTGEVIGDQDWLLKEAEQWCRDRSMYLTITKAISIYDGSETKLTAAAIPSMMETALAISFETSIRT